MLLLRLFEEVMWLLFSRPENAASEEDVNCVVIMDLFLCSQAADHAGCEFFLDQVLCKFHVSALHDSIKLI